MGGNYRSMLHCSTHEAMPDGQLRLQKLLGGPATLG